MVALAVLAVSAAAVLVRLAGDAHPAAVGFWRCAGAAVLLAPWIRPLPRRDALLTLLAGALLAAHFWSWFASLATTSVMRSTVLVTLAPIWVGLLEWLVLRDAPPRRFWAGIGVAVAGVALMTATGGDSGPGSVGGDALALLGGVFGAGYFVVGRAVRPRVPIGTYGALVSGAAALWLLPVVWGADAALTGFPPAAWAALAGLVVGPQLLGHVGLNYAVRYLTAAFVSSVVLLEPVGATLLAVAVFGEVPSPAAAAGAAVTVVGVLVATRA